MTNTTAATPNTIDIEGRDEAARGMTATATVRGGRVFITSTGSTPDQTATVSLVKPSEIRELWAEVVAALGWDDDAVMLDLIEPLIAAVAPAFEQTCRFIPVTELRVGDMVAGAEVIGLQLSASGKTAYIKIHSIAGGEYEYSQSTASRIAIFNR